MENKLIHNKAILYYLYIYINVTFKLNFINHFVFVSLQSR